MVNDTLIVVIFNFNMLLRSYDSLIRLLYVKLLASQKEIKLRKLIHESDS
jgi:hypothetical protein